MSQQFVFWRTSDQLDSAAVYAALGEGAPVDGLDELDLGAAEQALIAAFPTWTVEGRRGPAAEQTMLGGPDGQGGIDVGYTPQSVTVTCYGMSTDEWNQVIEAMATLRLPLYDPQIDERFDAVDL